MREAYICRTFVDTRIDLTGCFAYNCMFDGCIVELNHSEIGTSIAKLDFYDCMLIGNGWPQSIRDRVNKGNDHG